MDIIHQVEFETLLTGLKAQLRENDESLGGYKLEKCERCHDSLFTKNSKDCYSCTYCTGCERSTHCTHCHDCLDVHTSTYCRNSQFCTGCSYVSESLHCHDCLFCVGCTGLIKKEFHILNTAYPKDVFFKLVDKLEKELGRKLR